MQFEALQGGKAPYGFVMYVKHETLTRRLCSVFNVDHVLRPEMIADPLANTVLIKSALTSLAPPMDALLQCSTVRSAASSPYCHAY